ncbi:MAG: putative membrane protein [Pirellulaceae bacterium]
MNKITIVFGVVLVGLGALGYFGGDPEHRSPTAWIPAFVGIPLIICGLLALKESMLKHAMHGAAVFGLLGALAAGGRGLTKIGTLFSDDPDVNKRATVMVLLMFVICTAFIVLCIKSFRDARKRREAAQQEAS